MVKTSDVEALYLEYEDTIFPVVWTLLTMLFVGYLIVVYYIGPWFMKNREAYNILWVIRTYNILQVCCCTFFVVQAHRMGFTFNLMWRCEHFDNLDKDARFEAKVGFWMFLCLRCFEFLETMFFLLRKKFNQASFLHVFHHIGSVFFTWLFIVMDAELMAVYIALINSVVHIFMYTYYFWSSFRIKSVLAVTNKIKPFITIMQLLQFGVIITHCTVAILPDCNASYYFHIQIFNFVVLTYLFGDFFVKSFLIKKKEAQPDFVKEKTTLTSQA